MDEAITFSSIYGTRKRPVLSFEFFPPKKDEDLPAARELFVRLKDLSPDFMTVTYGAGGGTREKTRHLVAYIVNELKVPAVAHLTCVDHSRDEINQILDSFEQSGIKHVLALRGDPPKGVGRFVPHPEGFRCARDLTAHIKQRTAFSIAVAGYPETHPEAASPAADMLYLKDKVAAGGEIVITQLFFDPALYFSFLNNARALGVAAPIVPGIMPISNIAQLERFTSMCGATIPASLNAVLLKLKDDSQAILDFGIDFAVQMCRQLIEGGAPGLHFYTLNKSSQVERIVRLLGAEGLI